MKPNTKLKQWCYDKAEKSIGMIMPFLGNNADVDKNNIRQFEELNKRAKKIYDWVTNERVNK